MSRRQRVVGMLAVTAAVLMRPGIAEACAVCFGDPNADATRGVQSAIVVLAAVVYAVLFGMAGIAVSWLVRARNRP